MILYYIYPRILQFTIPYNLKLHYKIRDVSNQNQHFDVKLYKAI